HEPGFGEPPLLDFAQRRADLNEMQHRRLAKSGHRLGRAQRIVKERAAPGAELDDAKIFRRAHLAPDRRHPDPDTLPNLWANLRRGDETAAATERIALNVVAVLRMRQTQPHVIGDRYWPADRDPPSDFIEQRGGCVSHFLVSAGAGTQRRAQ